MHSLPIGYVLITKNLGLKSRLEVSAQMNIKVLISALFLVEIQNNLAPEIITHQLRETIIISWVAYLIHFFNHCLLAFILVLVCSRLAVLDAIGLFSLCRLLLYKCLCRLLLNNFGNLASFVNPTDFR